MFLIMSGAYVDQELRAEFGFLPPSFLPIGNQRVYKKQIELIDTHHKIYLSLPKSFSVPNQDDQWLEQKKINLIFLDENLSLGESLLACLESHKFSKKESIKILYGDTLFKKLPNKDNIASVSKINSNYDWAVLSKDNATLQENKIENLYASNKAISGYFSFSDPKFLIKSLKKNNNNFIRTLNYYFKNHFLKTETVKNWMDLGHVNTYHQSKASYTTQRSFNDLDITFEKVTKKSRNILKIVAEANWYEKIPPDIKLFTPIFLEKSENKSSASYSMEYLYLNSLSDLYVFGKLPYANWKNILNKCLDFVEICRNNKSKNKSHSFKNFLIDKTIKRLNQYCSKNKISFNQKWEYEDISISLNELLLKINELISEKNFESAVSHGDLCFSNILFDPKANRIKVLDPRGLNYLDQQNIYGDIRYDLSKLCHSVIGGYDHIISGLHRTKIETNTIDIQFSKDNDLEKLEAFLISSISKRFNISPAEIYAVQIHLFLSMLPLHSDNKERQKGFFANAFRIYKLLLELKS